MSKFNAQKLVHHLSLPHLFLSLTLYLGKCHHLMQAVLVRELGGNQYWSSSLPTPTPESDSCCFLTSSQILAPSPLCTAIALIHSSRISCLDD